MKIAIRADASIAIGTGHIMRCLTLADALDEKGVEIVFLCRPHSGSLIDLICEKGYSVFCLEDSISNADSSLMYSGWLGSTQKKDAQQCAQYLKDNLVDWLIVDHYGLDKVWQLELEPYYRKLMVIDDLGDRAHTCDIILDQNFGSTKKKYQYLVPESCQILVGSDFTLLRPEFREWRQYSVKRRHLRDLGHLLINLGGVDSDNVTTQLILELENCDLPKHLCITVVLGPTAPHLDKVEQAAKQSKYSVSVITGASNMAQIMSNADLAIGAAGSTSWERCSLGLPTILLAIADNQQPIAIALAEAGAAQIMKQVNQLSAQISEARLKLLELSKISLKIVDGRGSVRVSHFLSKAYFNEEKQALVPYTALTPEQVSFVLDMRNHAEIRKWMHKKSLISKSEHLAFVDSLVVREDKQFFLVQHADKVLGTINFTGINLTTKKAEFGIFANPFLSEKGRGNILTALAVKYARSVLKLTQLDLVVFAGNKVAIDLYEKFGFIQMQQSVTNNQCILKMTKFLVEDFKNEN